MEKLAAYSIALLAVAVIIFSVLGMTGVLTITGAGNKEVDAYGFRWIVNLTGNDGAGGGSGSCKVTINNDGVGASVTGTNDRTLCNLGGSGHIESTDLNLSAYQHIVIHRTVNWNIGYQSPSVGLSINGIPETGYKNTGFREQLTGSLGDIIIDNDRNVLIINGDHTHPLDAHVTQHLQLDFGFGNGGNTGDTAGLSSGNYHVTGLDLTPFPAPAVVTPVSTPAPVPATDVSVPTSQPVLTQVYVVPEATQPGLLERFWNWILARWRTVFG